MSATDTDSVTATNEVRPNIASLQDLTLITAIDSKTEEEVWFGQLFRDKFEITIPEYSQALKSVKDEEIYPHIPEDFELKIASEHLNDDNSWIKRPGLTCYESMVELDHEYIPTELLNEALAMETVSKLNHPNIIEYLGCRVRRGFITSFIIERLDHSLMQFVSQSEFAQLDKRGFVEALQSALDAIHGLGLAHNDLNPYNIMIKNGMPVLIDFGSCLSVGKRLQTGGTKGWVESHTYVSDTKHDEYAMRKLSEWLQNPET